MEKENLEILFEIAEESLMRTNKILNRDIIKYYLQLNTSDMMSLSVEVDEIKAEMRYLKKFIEILSRGLEKEG